MKKKRENYKGPSQNNEDILEHFYKLQQQKLTRLAKYDLNLFAMRVNNRRMLKKVVLVLKTFTFNKSEKAKAYFKMVRLNKCFKELKLNVIPRLKEKRVTNQINEIYRLFQTKRILAAWREYNKHFAKMHTIGEMKH